MRCSNSIVMLARIAAKTFGGNDGIFTSATFALVAESATGIPLTEMDGKIIALILANRPEIIQLDGDSHWKVV